MQQALCLYSFYTPGSEATEVLSTFISSLERWKTVNPTLEKFISILSCNILERNPVIVHGSQVSYCLHQCNERRHFSFQTNLSVIPAVYSCLQYNVCNVSKFSFLNTAKLNLVAISKGQTLCYWPGWFGLFYAWFTLDMQVL